MRLINVGTFTLQEFPDAGAAPPYAILSHCWCDEEVTYQDLQNLEVAQNKIGFEKIQYACLQARADGLAYAWVDTCCIDKSSSHELSEAINSMYRWYMNAALCYVYLSDVPGNCPVLNDNDHVHPISLRWIEAFEESRWFTRGWTLQELIAPRIVLFFGSYWNPIGALSNLVQRVSGITGIEADVLNHTCPLSDLSIAQRLSWAAMRKTTRTEDQAYVRSCSDPMNSGLALPCNRDLDSRLIDENHAENLFRYSMFGILDVNMPLLYGEGSKAFTRLQEEIIRQSTDQSILAWDAPADSIESRELLLAPSPRCFANASKIIRRRGSTSDSAFRISNKGLEITLPIMWRRFQDAQYNVILGILDCKYEGSSDVLALVMNQHPFNMQGGTVALELYISGFQSGAGYPSDYSRLVPIPLSALSEAKPALLTITRDLHSQTYIQDFNDNKDTWFPVRFMGDEPVNMPKLLHVYPEECWNETTRTMRLRASPPRIPIRKRSTITEQSIASHDYLGGIVVETMHQSSVLIVFGPSGAGIAPARWIYAMTFVDKSCPIKPHLNSLFIELQPEDVKVLRLSMSQQLVARLWRGALTVSVEKTSDAPISPPSSPLSQRPALNRPSASAPSLRRDSLLENGRFGSTGWRSSRDKVPLTPDQSVHRTTLCVHCEIVRLNKADEQERKRLDKLRKANEEEADRQKTQRRQKMKTRATQAGVGLSIGSVLADVAEFL